MMSVLTKDRRFEEACGRAEEGAEIKNMCEVLDIVENRGIQKGLLEGRQEGRQEGRREGRQEGRIYEYIDIRREDGYSEEEISHGIIRKFGLTEEQASEYLNGLFPDPF